MKVFQNRYIGLMLLVLLVLSILGFSIFPDICNIVYTNGVFVLFRTIYDFTLGHLPFPSIYIIFPCLLYFLFFKIYRISKEGIIATLVFIFNFFAAFIFCFYLLWGFNYYTPSLSERIGLSDIQLDKQYIVDQIEDITPRIAGLRTEISSDSSLAFLAERNLKFEGDIRLELESVIEQYGYSTQGRVRVKSLLSGVLLRFRTSGIYIPYVLEGHLDGGLHPLQWPFTMTHEMAHGYGVTDERECNFIAYLVCMRLPQKEVQYSAYVAYWRYLMSALKKVDRDKFTELYNKMNPLFITDLNAIYAYVDRYPEWMPTARDKIYDNYLKAHGVNDGIVSYNKMIEMIAAYNEKFEKD